MSKAEIKAPHPVLRFDTKPFANLREQIDKRYKSTLRVERYSDDESLPEEYMCEYTVVGNGQPSVFVNGLNATVEGTRNFALDYALLGNRLLMVEQNCDEVKTRAGLEIDPTTAQALNHLAAIEAEGLHATPGLNVITHSYGSLIFQRMVELAKEFGWECFDDSHVVLVAPAGVNKQEKLRSLAWRFRGVVFDEGHLGKVYDKDKRMYKAVRKVILSRPKQVVREIRDIARLTYDPAYVASNGIRQTILGHPEDPVFTQQHIQEFMSEHEHIDPAISWSEPYSAGHRLLEVDLLQGNSRLSRKTKKLFRAISNAAGVHDDALFNTRRAAEAIDDILSL